MAFTCPACGAALEFKSRFSTMTVCSFCQAILLRKDDRLIFNGKMATLPDNISPFQIGTKGSYQNQAFEIIGQLVVSWQEGYWNEWCLQESSGDQAWLAEAMGFLSYTHEVSLKTALKDAQFYSRGDKLVIENNQYIISDIKPIECTHCVGELPFDVTLGMKGTSVDLLTTGADCAFLDFTNQQYRFYVGKNVSFEDLNLTNLRVIDGW